MKKRSHKSTSPRVESADPVDIGHAQEFFTQRYGEARKAFVRGRGACVKSLAKLIEETDAIEAEEYRDAVIMTVFKSLFQRLSLTGKHEATIDCVTALNRLRDSAETHARCVEFAKSQSKWPGFFYGKGSEGDSPTDAFAKEHLSDFRRDAWETTLQREVYAPSSRPHSEEVKACARDLMAFLMQPHDQPDHPCRILFVHPFRKAIYTTFFAETGVSVSLPLPPERSKDPILKSTGVKFVCEKTIRDCMTYLYGPKRHRIRLYVRAVLTAKRANERLKEFEKLSPRKIEAYFENTWPAVVDEVSATRLVSKFQLHCDDMPKQKNKDGKTMFIFPKFKRRVPAGWESDMQGTLVKAAMDLIPDAETDRK